MAMKALVEYPARYLGLRPRSQAEELWRPAGSRRNISQCRTEERCSAAGTRWSIFQHVLRLCRACSTRALAGRVEAGHLGTASTASPVRQLVTSRVDLVCAGFCQDERSVGVFSRRGRCPPPTDPDAAADAAPLASRIRAVRKLFVPNREGLATTAVDTTSFAL